MSTQKSKPQMSINKLGEYLITDQARQRRILEQLKYPKEHVYSASYYEDARRVAKKFFLGGFQEDIILDGIRNLETQENLSSFQETKRSANIEALESILNSSILTDIEDAYDFEEYTGNNERLFIEGVEVSVYPDLIVKSQIRKNNYIGALKFHFNKQGTFKENAGCEYIATMIYHYALSFITIPTGFSIRNTNCISFDVFENSFVKCPVAIKTRLGQISAGCKNIVAIWDTI